MRLRSVLLACALCIAGAQAAGHRKHTPRALASAPVKPVLGDWGIDLKSLDPSVKPGDDFFAYVNGGWLKATDIPADQGSAGVFQILRKLSATRLGEIVAELQQRPYDRLSPDEKKLRDLYEAFVDRQRIEADGLTPAASDLAAIAQARTLDDVARLLGTARMNLSGPFMPYVGVDDHNSEAYALILYQGNLGMPDRDYYVSDSPDLDSIRRQYKVYLAAMLIAAGVPDAPARTQAVYALEEKLAQAQWSRADNSKADKIYNAMTVSELAALAPDFPWRTFLDALGVPLASPKGERALIVAQKSAFPVLAKIFAQTPMAVWRDYLTVQYLHGFASYLPQAIEDGDFAFYGKALRGAVPQSRETRGVQLLDKTMGWAIGRLYVAKYFPPESKKKVGDIAKTVIAAYTADLRVLPWMSPATRQKAQEKLNTLLVKIGYPERWVDYSGYTVTPGALLASIEAGLAFEWRREIGRLDLPMDRDEWGLTPPTVNAYYNPAFNEIVLPAAILQSPYFDAGADDAVNYGAIGVTIATEISHGLDGVGSYYDASGNSQAWWTSDDRRTFDARATALRQQYNTVAALPGLYLRGANTQEEDVADLAGLEVALQAYHLSLGGKPAPVRDGYTGDQRFLLSHAQNWREKSRPNVLRNAVTNSEFSPPQFRVIGTTRNLDAWYDAFGVEPGDMYYVAPERRVHFWQPDLARTNP